MIIDVHVFNNNIFFCLTCTPCLPVLMSQWLSSFPPASDPIFLSVALFKNSYSHAIILFIKLHIYHCFTLLCFSVSVFWQFSAAPCLDISNIFPNLHSKILNILTLWLLSTSWAQQISAHLGWRLSKIYIGAPLFNFKIMIDPLDMKMQHLGFHNSLREAWADRFLIIFILLFSLYDSNMHFSFASSITFLSCFLHSGRSFRNFSTENLFLAS